MTFGFIGNILGNVAEVIGYNKASEVFLPEFCPIVKIGEKHWHMLHSSRSNVKDAVQMLNTIVDFNLALIEITTNNSDAIKAIDDSFDVIYNKLKKIIRNLNGPDTSFNNKLYNILEKIFKKLDHISLEIKDQKINEYISQLEDKIDSLSINAFAESMSKRHKNLEKQSNRIEDKLETITKVMQSLDPDILLESLGNSFSKQNQKIAKEISDLQKNVGRLFDEVKFDPDKPKPTEIQTEINSQQILKISKELAPLLKESKDAIEQSNRLLLKIAQKIGGI